MCKLGSNCFKLDCLFEHPFVDYKNKNAAEYRFNNSQVQSIYEEFETNFLKPCINRSDCQDIYCDKEHFLFDL